ncbi:hypothetical protein CKK33_18825 [Mucilaginibacter sp. MD40]|uniref:hypothetical protein n=1 Tax=Mucilaginibacter sp. MD40 TaxID=2029590 RepID=UPI000BACAB23|nr:hypothetical protein [Mucilaginibacter sp. MD40]PAW95441.1 hypothetical protein CKK33_18825 [Mucilaginibacter sp. MD40]
MKWIFIIPLLLIQCYRAKAQQYVIDYQHLIAVSQNAAVRSSAELTHDQYLGKINSNINDLNTNVGSVVLAQTMIYEGLSNVNSALKDGLAVKNMAVIIADMTGYINQALAMAKNQPYLLLFAESIASEMRERSLALVSDVSGYVLKEGNNVLADYNARDQLLRKVITQLHILDGLAYGTWKAMYWAKERGVIASLNPFANFISQDTRLVGEIIQNAKYLRQ